METISFETAKERGLLVPGTKIVSYPNHKGEILEGVILGVFGNKNEIAVDYTNKGRHTLRSNGKLHALIDTNIDINLVKIEKNEKI